MKKFCGLLMVGFLSAIIPCITSAANRTFTGGSGNWSDPLNWSGFTVPVDGDTVLINQPWGKTTNDLSGVRVFDLTVSQGNEIYGNAIHVSAFNATGLASGNTIIHADVTLNAPTTLLCGYASDTFRIKGDLRLNGNTLTVLNNNADDVFLSGVIMGTGNLVKQGANVLEIAGDMDNTFIGTVTVERGTLRLNKINGGVGQIAVPGDLSISLGTSSATVEYEISRQVANTSTITVKHFGTLNLNNFSDIIGSLVLLQGAVTTGSGTLTLQDDISCPVVSGNLATSNSILGNIAWDSSDTHLISTSTNIDLLVLGTVSGAGNFTHTGHSTGELYLSGTNTFTGIFTNAIGSVFVAANGLGDTNTPTVVTGGTLFINDDVLNEPLTLVSPGELFGGLGTNKFSGNITAVGSPRLKSLFGSELNLTGVIGGSGFIVGFGAVALSGKSNNVYSGSVSVAGGKMLLNKNTNAIAITGPLDIGLLVGVTGTVEFQKSGQIAAAAPVTVYLGLLDLNDSDATLTNLTVYDHVTTGTGVLTIAGTLNAIRNVSPTPVIEGIVSFGNRTCTLNIASSGSAPDLDLRADLISTGGSGGFSTTNSGILWLSGSNTYSGLTYISNGVVRCDSNQALGAGNATILSEPGSLYLNGVTVDEDLDVSSDGNGTYAAFDATNKASLIGTIFLRTNSTIGVKANSTLTLTNTLSGLAGKLLTKTGAGTLVFDGASRYAAPFVVSQGTLLVNSTSTATPITILAGAGIGGSGKVADLTNSGTVFPGDYNSTTGAVLTAGNIISSGGKFSFDLGTFGTNHDRLVLSSMTGSTTLEIFDRTNNLLPNGSSQTIVTKLLGIASVPFTGLPENSVITSTNHNFILTYRGGGSNDVALTVAARNGAAATMGAIKSLGAGVFQVNATGSVNAVYSVLTATNLTTPVASWNSVSNVIANGSGAIQLNRNEAVNESQRYYRLKAF